jgi:hypothetical protein
VNSSEIDKIFDRMRKAGHGAVIKFDAFGTGQPIEAIIFEPNFRRPPGFTTGVFVTVPSERGALYYFDPEASKKQGRIIIQKFDTKKEKEEPQAPADDILAEFEHIRTSQGVKMGGGAVGESYSKYSGILDLEK